MKKTNRLRTFDHEDHGVDSEGSWMISYGDMITLLLTFFILFFSIDPKVDHAKALDASLIAILNPKSTPQPESLANSKTLNVGTEEGTNIEKALIDKWGAQVHQVGSRILVEFQGTSFFNSGDINLTREGAEKLRTFANMYTPFSGRYTLGIRAFTDEKAVVAVKERRYKDNLELSALRSVATMRVLQKAGLPLNRMRLGGYGELRVTARDLAGTGQGFALARKIVLVIEPAEEDVL